MCYLPAISVNRWLAVRLGSSFWRSWSGADETNTRSVETVGSCLIFIGAILSCIALVTTGVNAGLVGLMISYGFNTTGALVSLPVHFFRYRRFKFTFCYPELVCPMCQRSRAKYRLCRANSAPDRSQAWGIWTYTRYASRWMANPRKSGIQVSDIYVTIPMVLIYSFRDYSMRYRPELDLVLRDISLTIVSLTNWSVAFDCD